jgi:hypothetical protein
MFIIVTGPREGKVNKKLEEYIKTAIYFFSKKLNINDLKINMHVFVHNRIHDNGSYSMCEQQKDKNKYKIDVCLYNDWITSLAHEMVHVKQFVNGEINDKILLRDIGNHDEYRNVFYEKEAFSLQRVLVDEFIEDLY